MSNNKLLPVQSVENLTALIDKQESNLAALLPKNVDVAFMRANFVAAIAANPKLLNCTQTSLMKAVFEACELGLMVHSSLGEAYLVPHGNTATFIPGYKGLVKLAYQSGFVKLIESRVVCANDDFICEYGLDPRLSLIEMDANRGAPIGVYCKVDLLTGGTLFQYMTMAKIQEIHNKSSAYQYFKKTGKGKEIWDDAHNKLEMDMKAVWLNLSKWVPREGKRFTKAIDLDNSQYRDDWGKGEENPEDALYEEVGVNNDTPMVTLGTSIHNLWNMSLRKERDESYQILSLMGFPTGVQTDEEALSVLTLIVRADMLRGKKSSEADNNVRVLRFFRYCILNNYALDTTRNVDSARSAFVKYEREENA